MSQESKQNELEYLISTYRQFEPELIQMIYEQGSNLENVIKDLEELKSNLSQLEITGFEKSLCR